MSRTVLGCVAAGALLLGGSAAFVLAPSGAPSQHGIAAAVHDCGKVADDAFHAGRQIDGQRFWDGCFERSLWMTADQVRQAYDPIAELPRCDDIWAIGNQPDNMQMMDECQYGSDPARAFKPTLLECRGRTYVFNVFVGPNNRYLDGRNLEHAVVTQGDPQQHCPPIR